VAGTVEQLAYGAAVAPYGPDIFTEPPGSPDTLGHLGPLRGLAGVWHGPDGVDEHPVAGGTEVSAYVERYEAQPIDRQTNGPQLFYGLRYHTHIVEPGEVETFHDQVGYWLWEPVTSVVTFSLAIPRGQVVLASGPVDANATTFEVTAVRGSDTQGIVSNPFLELAFRTLSFRMAVTVHPDGTWSYEQETMLQLPDDVALFSHTDKNRLVRIGPPVDNPMAVAAAAGDGGSGLGLGSLRPLVLPRT